MRNLFAFSLMMLGYSTCFASAYQIFEQDAASLGTNHAGSAAAANDASTEWYNPAGMTHLKQQQLSVGGELVNTNIRYTGTQTNSNQTNPALRGPQSVNGVNGGGLTPVPNIHYVLPLGRWAFGIGVVAPFGAETNYGDSTALQYSGTKTKLQSIDITPAVAFQVTKFLSVGVGADIAYVTGEFDNTFAYYSADNPATYPNIPVTNKGDDITYGFHAGFLIDFNKNNRFGLAYHSKMVANLTGTTSMSGDTSGVTVGGRTAISGDDFSTQIILPAWWNASYYFQATQKLALMASVMYTEWDAVDQVVLKNVVTPFGDEFQDITIQQSYSNTWNFAVGASYQLTSAWKLKAGMGYDITPTNDQYRNIQIPDQNRFVLSTGVEYQLLKSLSIALSYAHFFVQRASIDTSQDIAGTTQTTQGYVQSSADLFGLQLKWNL